MAKKSLKKRYEIRYWVEGTMGSRSIGFKGKLFKHDKAKKLVKKLKKLGIDAYIAPWVVFA
jgi:hypothetical protein